MSKLVELDVVLRLHEQNFRNLHWNAKGNDFDDSHKSITTEYYEMVSADVDKVAEILAIKGIDPPNYMEIAEYINHSETTYSLVDSKRHYTRADIIKMSDIMLNEICKLLAVCIEELEDDIMAAGIKSELETLLYNYTLQAKYINKRRMEE